MELKSDCLGCRCLKWIPQNNQFECKFTKIGKLDILGCLCKECLVKIMCKKLCYNFIETSKNNNEDLIFLPYTRLTGD